MQPLQGHKDEESDQSSLVKFPFSPLPTNKLDDSYYDFPIFSASYCQKHNLLTTYSDRRKFYDATTLMRLGDDKIDEKFEAATDLSSFYEINACILKCRYKLISIKGAYKEDPKQIEFVTSTFDVSPTSNPMSILSIYGGFLLQESDVIYLRHHFQRNLLFLNFPDGRVRASPANNLPHWRTVCSIRAEQSEQTDQRDVAIQNIRVNDREYIITSDLDSTVKIWHLTKGRMKLLRVIQIEGTVSWFAYLQNYKMIAIAITGGESDFIGFFKLFSGTLIDSIYFLQSAICNMFVMNDKNILGVVGRFRRAHHNSIRFISLHGGNQEM